MNKKTIVTILLILCMASMAVLMLGGTKVVTLNDGIELTAIAVSAVSAVVMFVIKQISKNDKLDAEKKGGWFDNPIPQIIAWIVFIACVAGLFVLSVDKEKIKEGAILVEGLFAIVSSIIMYLGVKKTLK